MVSTPPQSPTKDQPAAQARCSGDGAASSKAVQQQKPGTPLNNKQVVLHSSATPDRQPLTANR